MVGSGRESRKDNDLFFTCGLIDYIARKTKNVRADVVNQLGNNLVIVDWVCQNVSFLSMSFTWHVTSLLNRTVKTCAADPLQRFIRS